MDPQTFKILNLYYIRDENNVFISVPNKVKGFHFRKTVGIDLNTFAVLGNSKYAKDKEYVYNRWGKVVEEADIKTFRLMDFGYAKDKSRVYDDFSAVKNSEIDIKTVQVIYPPYIKDKKNVYWHADRINGAEVETFEIVMEDYPSIARDKNNVYREGKKIKKADPKTFERITFEYSKDKSHIFWREEIITLAVPQTFKLLGLKKMESTPYSRDEKNVFFENKCVAEADVETFRVTGCPVYDKSYGRDKNNIYLNGQRLRRRNVLEKIFEIFGFTK